MDGSCQLSEPFGGNNARAIMAWKDGYLALTTSSYRTVLWQSSDALHWEQVTEFPEIWGQGMRLDGDDLLVFGMQRNSPTREAVVDRDLWKNVWEIGNGTEYLSWFGFFENTNLPWIEHETLGWFMSNSTSADDIEIYYPEKGNFHTTKDMYPLFRDASGKHLVRLEHGNVLPVDDQAASSRP